MTSALVDIWAAYSQAIGLTLLHSLWQGALIYVIFQFLIINNKKTVSALGLYWPVLALGGSMTFTFLLLGEETGGLVSSGFVNSPGATANWLQLFLFFWMIGMAIQLIRLSMDYFKLVYWRSQGELTTSGPLFNRVRTLSQKLKIDTEVKLKMIQDLAVPMVVGFFRPLILFPVCLVNQLTAEELDGILLHELYHIKRRDYFWNLILRMMEVILFFNPFSHLVVKEIRIRREMSCDRIAALVSRRPRALANALLRIEEISQNPSLAMSLNSEGHLTQRIYSLLNIGVRRKRSSSFGTLLTLLAFIPFALGFEADARVTDGPRTSGTTADSIRVPGVQHTIHSLEFKTTGGEIRDVRINEENVVVNNSDQIDALRSKMTSNTTASNRVEEYNEGLEKKFHDARIRTRKEPGSTPRFKIHKVEEEEIISLSEAAPVLNLASIDGYHYGKSFDTLHQWFELSISDEELAAIQAEKHEMEQTYFFHLSTDPEPKAHKDVLFLYEPEEMANHQMSSSNIDRPDIDELMEMMLVEHGLLSSTYAYQMTLTHKNLIVNGEKAESPIHRLFRNRYTLLLGKSPTSNFNYQIFKNQVQ